MTRRALFALAAMAPVVPALPAKPVSPAITMEPFPVCCDGFMMVRVERNFDRRASVYRCPRCGRGPVVIADILLEGERQYEWGSQDPLEHILRGSRAGTGKAG